MRARKPRREVVVTTASLSTDRPGRGGENALELEERVERSLARARPRTGCRGSQARARPRRRPARRRPRARPPGRRRPAAATARARGRARTRAS
ncbi:MAG: hypothetical protein E6G15_09555 [Actinobacteria bacterium]|nr:MAG: hypothetical protein E6G15_09555 [Actinomycetota bacterium]